MNSSNEPRIDYLRYEHGTDVELLLLFCNMHIVMRLLPTSIFWVNTQGAQISLYNQKGLVSKAYFTQIHKSIILAKTYYIDGPYLSHEHLEASSPAYNIMINPNPIKATQILLDSIKRKYNGLYSQYFNPDFIDKMPYILEHTFIGNNKNGSLTGIHYHTSNVRFIQAIRSTLESKSPYYRIEMRNPLTDEILSKKDPSTFWPPKWPIEKCVIECAIAWSNKIASNTIDVFIGYTSNGLKIKFCFRGNKLRTVYPDESNND